VKSRLEQLFSFGAVGLELLIFGIREWGGEELSPTAASQALLLKRTQVSKNYL